MLKISAKHQSKHRRAYLAKASNNEKTLREEAAKA